MQSCIARLEFQELDIEASHAAGAFYLRLVGKPLEVYQYLEPLYNDYRRIRLRTEEGHFTLTHVDELVDEMLRNEYLFDIALPRVPNRYTPLPQENIPF